MREGRELRAYYAFLGFSALHIAAGLTAQIMKPAAAEEVTRFQQEAATL